jgi:hypothetical protein
MFRQFIRLREILRKSEAETDASEIAVLVNEGLKTMENFESTYGQFCEKCTSEFYRLSRAAKVSSGMFPRQFYFVLLTLLSIHNTVLEPWSSLSC